MRQNKISSYQNITDNEGNVYGQIVSNNMNSINFRISADFYHPSGILWDNVEIVKNNKILFSKKVGFGTVSPKSIMIPKFINGEMYVDYIDNFTVDSINNVVPQITVIGTQDENLVDLAQRYSYEKAFRVSRVDEKVLFFFESKDEKFGINFDGEELLYEHYRKIYDGRCCDPYNWRIMMDDEDSVNFIAQKNGVFYEVIIEGFG